MNQAQLIEAIDRPQTQVKPLLAESVFKKSATHKVMLVGETGLNGNGISFAAVKGVNTWAVYYAYGQRSESYLASSGIKATITQVQKWIDIEGELDELYRG